MCLRINNEFISEKPITVYKALKIRYVYNKKNECKVVYDSPYHQYRWEKGKKEVNQQPIDIVSGNLTCGVFHSYEYVEDAICDRESWDVVSKGSDFYVVGKFTIPAGVKVYKGDAQNAKSYGSRELIFDGVIDLKFSECQAVYGMTNYFYLPRWDRTDEEITEEVKKTISGFNRVSVESINFLNDSLPKYLEWRKKFYENPIKLKKEKNTNVS